VSPAVTRPPDPALPFSAEASLAPGRVQIGERISLTVSIDAPASLVSARLRLDERLGPLEVVGIEASPEARRAERWRQRWTISAISFETGTIEVPDLPIEYVTVDGRTFVAPWPPRASVVGTGPAVTADTPLRGLGARLDAPPPSPWRAVAIGAAAVAIGVPLIGLPLVRWWIRRANRIRHAAFYRSLATAIAELARTPCADEDDARGRYTRASALVRQGAAPLAGGPIETLTSTELAGRVSGTTGDGAPLASRLGVLLRAVDSVRFGRVVPAVAQHAAVLHEAQGLVAGMGNASAPHAVSADARKGAR
jgi:hypothetical protein